MLTAIDFYRQVGFETKEVKNVRADAVLSAEFQTQKTFPPKALPKPHFRIRLPLTQLTTAIKENLFVVTDKYHLTR